MCKFYASFGDRREVTLRESTMFDIATRLFTSEQLALEDMNLLDPRCALFFHVCMNWNYISEKAISFP